MTDVAIVAPLEVHKRMDEANVLGNYQLLLAHEVLAHPNAYQEFWGPKRNQFIIMDNSLVELKKALPMSAVLEAGATVGAKVVVMPDVMGDRAKTYEAFAKAYDQLEELRKTSEYARDVKLLGVAQGQAHMDVFSCGRDLLRAGVDMISVPRHVADSQRSRMLPTAMLARYGTPIHLLGFSNNLWDDFAVLSSVRGVTGIDSALPVWLGMSGQLLPKVPPQVNSYGRRPKNYAVLAPRVLPPEVIANIRRVREWENIVRAVPTETSVGR